jgi:CheY-like chemotaxis protein
MHLRNGAWSVSWPDPGHGRLQRETLGAPTGSPETSTTGRVLIADDEPCARRHLRQVLELEGHEVLESRAGTSAIAEAALHAPDLVVLVARGTGAARFATCRRLRSDPRTRELRVLLVLDAMSLEDRIRGTLSGADDFLSEPYDAEEATRRVRVAVWAQRREDALVAENLRLRMLAGAGPRTLSPSPDPEPPPCRTLLPGPGSSRALPPDAPKGATRRTGRDPVVHGAGHPDDE